MLDIREVDYIAKLGVSKYIISMFKLLLPKIVLLLLLSSTCFIQVAGQNDSTLIQLKTSAFTALEKGELDSARIFFKLIIANYRDQPRAVGLSYNNLGVIDLKEGFNIRALTYSNRAIEVYKGTGNDTLVAKSLYNAARIFKRLGQYEKAVEFLLEAIILFEENELNDDLSRAYNVLSNLYQLIDNLDLALRYNNYAVEIATENKDSTLIAYYVNNRGKIYIDMDFYNKAITDFKKALEIKILLSDQESLANTYYNLGEKEYLRYNFNEAQEYFEKAIDIYKQYEDNQGIAYTLNYLGSISGSNHNWKLAMQQLSQAESIANQSNDKDVLLENYKSQSHLFRDKEEFERALYYTEKYIAVNEEILNIEKQEVINELQVKYEVEKKEKENQLLEQQTEIDTLKIIQQETSIRYLKYTTIASSFLIVVALLLGYWFYLLSKKAQKQALVEKELATKEKRFNTEQHHRIKNHLQLLAGLLSFQQRKLENIAAKEVIQESSNRVKVITTLHQHFYQSNDLSKTVIQLDTYLENLIGNLSLLFKQPETKVMVELEPIQIDADKALPLGLICNELITNAFKYGLTNSDTSILHITLENKQQKHELSISDNGAGIKGNTHSSSIGLELIDQMVKQMDAKLNQQNNPGTSYTLIF
jgi:two-component sensor histidine kinase